MLGNRKRINLLWLKANLLIFQETLRVNIVLTFNSNCPHKGYDEQNLKISQNS